MDIVYNTNLVDILPTPLAPTQRNGCSIEEGVPKCLDIFLVVEEVIKAMGHVRSYLDSINISDHVPVCFQDEGLEAKVHYPCKFNNTWIALDDFQSVDL